MLDGDEARERWWRELRDRFDRPIDGYLRRLPLDANERRDIQSDLWANAVEQEAALMASSDLWPSIRKVPRELCAERKRRWRFERPLNDALLEVAAGSSVNARVHEEASYDQALDEWFEAALDELSPRERLAVKYYSGELSYGEIGRQLRVSESTARGHAKRAMDKLRQFAAAHPLQQNA